MRNWISQLYDSFTSKLRIKSTQKADKERDHVVGVWACLPQTIKFAYPSPNPITPEEKKRGTASPLAPARRKRKEIGRAHV